MRGEGALLLVMTRGRDVQCMVKSLIHALTFLKVNACILNFKKGITTSVKRK